MCNDCDPQLNRFVNFFCVYEHLTDIGGHDQEMWLKNYSRRSRDLRSMEGEVLAVFRGTGEFASSYWHLRTPADDVTDEIPSGYETEDVFIADADCASVLWCENIQ